MNGYGQPMVTPEQYGQALQAFDALSQRQQTQDNINRTGNPYAMLGAALSGMVANKFGKYKGQNLTDTSEQIRQFQEQKAAELEQVKQAKAQREAEIKRQQKLADEKSKFEREQAGRMQMAQFGIDNRQAPQARQPSQFEQLRNSMSQEQWQSYLNKQAGVQQQGGNPIYTKEEQALIAQNPSIEPQIRQKKIDDATGVDTAKEKDKAERLGKLSSTVNDLYAQLQNEGTETFGSDSKKMSTTYTDLLLQAKEAYELGVLSGPDLKLMTDVINDPTSVSSGVNPWAAGNIKGQLSEFAKRFGLQDPAEALKAPQQQGNQQGSDMVNKTNSLLGKYGAK